MTHKPKNAIAEQAIAHARIHVIQAVATKDVAAVVLHTEFNGEVIVTEGSSRRFLGDKKTKPDRPDEQLALTLAFSRALDGLNHRIKRYANGRIKHNDDTRAQQIARRKADEKAAKEEAKAEKKSKKPKPITV